MSNDEVIYPEKWGPHVWQALHYITLGYPKNPTEDQKLKYKTFFILLQDTLPCSVCANHYGNNLRNMPLTDEVLSDKESLVKWLIDFHNVVNEMKKKPIIKYVDARKMIDTDVPCEQPVEYVEKFTELKQTKQKPSHNLTKSELVKTSNKEINVCSSDNNLVYTLIGLLVSLIFIAIIYKKT
jgi:hypothetical protein